MYEVDPRTEEPSGSPQRPDARRAGAPADPRRLWIALHRRRLWIAGALLLGGVLALPLARALAPYDWVATTTVVWDPPPGVQASPDARELRTMVDQIELPANLAKVRRRLKLKEPVAVVGASVEVVDFDQASNVITIAAHGPDPEAAARLANTTVEVFLAYRIELEAARQRDIAGALDVDLERSRDDLAVAQRRYDAFRAEHGITDLSIDTQRAIEHAAEMRAQADLARADAQAEDARAKALSSEARRVGSTRVTESVGSSGPRAASPDDERLRQARLQLAEARSQYTAEHPAIRQLETRVRSLEAAAAAQEPEPVRTAPDRTVSANPRYEALMGHVVGSTAQREVATRRQQNLQALAEAAEASLRRLSAVEGEASTLLAAQRVAEAHVAELQELRARASDRGRDASTGLEVLARASPPEWPVSRARRAITAVAIPVGLLLGVILGVLGAALRGFRAWTAREVAWWGRAPVVGSSPWPRRLDAIEGLLEELEDTTAEAVGATLVVGATAGDTALARDLAFALDGFYASPIASVPAAVDPRPPAQTPGSYAVVDEGYRSPKKRRKGSRQKGARVESSSAALASVGPGGITAGTSRIDAPRAAYQPWDGPASGPVLRRACRLADRVLVVVRSGSLSFSDLGKMNVRLGRNDGIGYLLIGLKPELTSCPDRAGDVADFWRATRPGA